MDFYTILTDTGKAKVAAAQQAGQALSLKEMAVGDGNGSYHAPVSNQKSLVHEVWRGYLNDLSAVKENSHWVVAECVVPSNVGGFTIREAGMFDPDGDLIAVARYPETYKPDLASGVANDLFIKMILDIENASSVELSVDPGVVLASREFVTDHTERVDLHFSANERTKLASIANAPTRQAVLSWGGGLCTETTDVVGHAAKTYTGTGTSQDIDLGMDFSTGEHGGMVLIKDSGTDITGVRLAASSLGIGEELNTSSNETKYTDATGVMNYTPTGITVGSSTGINGIGIKAVIEGWNTTNKITESDGSIWQFNPATGFAMCTYTGTGISRELKHPMGKKLTLGWFKSLNASEYWVVYSDKLSDSRILSLNRPDGAMVSAAAFNSTQPTKSEITLGTMSNINADTKDYLLCGWFGDNLDHINPGMTGIEGSSAFMAVTGAGSFDCGFEPETIIAKRIDSTDAWHLMNRDRGWNRCIEISTSHREIIWNYNDAFHVDGTKISLPPNWLTGEYLIMAFGKTGNFPKGKTIQIKATEEEPFVAAIADGFNKYGARDRVVAIEKDTVYNLINDGEVPLTEDGLRVVPEHSNLFDRSENFEHVTTSQVVVGLRDADGFQKVTKQFTEAYRRLPMASLVKPDTYYRYSAIIKRGDVDYIGAYLNNTSSGLDKTFIWNIANHTYILPEWIPNVITDIKMGVNDVGDDGTKEVWMTFKYEGAKCWDGFGFTAHSNVSGSYFYIKQAQKNSSVTPMPYIKTEGASKTIPATPTTRIDITDKVHEELGPELLPNTEFANTDNIVANNTILSVTDGAITVADDGAWSRGVMTFSTEIGGVYELSCDIYSIDLDNDDVNDDGNGNRNGQVVVYRAGLPDTVSSKNATVSISATVANVWQTKSTRFVAVESSTKFLMSSLGSSSAKFRNPSVKKVTTIIDRNPIREALGGLPGGDERSSGVKSRWATSTVTDLGGGVFRVAKHTAGFEALNIADGISDDTQVEVQFNLAYSVPDLTIGTEEAAVQSGRNVYRGAWPVNLFYKTNSASASFIISDVSVKEVQPIRTEITVKDWVPGADWDALPPNTYKSILSSREGTDSILRMGNVSGNNGVIQSPDGTHWPSATLNWKADIPYNISVRCGTESDMLTPDGLPLPALATGPWYQLCINGVYIAPSAFNGGYPIEDWLTIPRGVPAIPMTYGAIQIKDLATGDLALDVNFKEHARDNHLLQASDIADGTYHINMDTKGLIRLDSTPPQYGREYKFSSGDYYDIDKGVMINEAGERSPSVYLGEVAVSDGLIVDLDVMPQGDEYETGWFPVQTNTKYVLPNRFKASNVEFDIYWNHKASDDDRRWVTGSSYWQNTLREGSGAHKRSTANELIVGTGATYTYNSVHSGDEFSQQGGYYKLKVRRGF